MTGLSLPDFPEVDDGVLRAISGRHDLSAENFTLLPQVGIFNLIYALGEDFVLRVPRDHPVSAADAREEAIAVPGVGLGRLRLGDPTWDFAGVPLRVVPSMLDGYREAGPPDEGGGLEARILWRHLQLSLYLLRREPQPGRSWAERPLAMLLDVMRFFLETPGGRWSARTP